MKNLKWEFKWLNPENWDKTTIRYYKLIFKRNGWSDKQIEEAFKGIK